LSLFYPFSLFFSPFFSPFSLLFLSFFSPKTTYRYIKCCEFSANEHGSGACEHKVWVPRAQPLGGDGLREWVPFCRRLVQLHSPRTRGRNARGFVRQTPLP
jgi:hypothetical protein